MSLGFSLPKIDARVLHLFSTQSPHSSRFGGALRQLREHRFRGKVYVIVSPHRRVAVFRGCHGAPLIEEIGSFCSVPSPFHVSHWTVSPNVDVSFLLEPSDGVPITSEALDISISWPERLGNRC